MEQKRILIVEDEVIVAMTLESVLQKLGYGVAGSVTNGPDAIQMAGEEMPDLILMDIRLEGSMDGIEAATRISARYGIPVVYLTAHSDQATLSRAIHTQPYGYLLKPFRERDLYTTIEMAFHKHRVIRQTEGKMTVEGHVPPASPKSAQEPKVTKGPAGLAEVVFDSLNCPVCVVDKDLKVALCNTAFSRLCSLFGPGASGLHQGVYATAPAALVGTTKDYLDVFSRKVTHRQEMNIRKDGREYAVLITFSPLKCEGSSYVVTTIADVTHIKQLTSRNHALFGAYEEVIGLLGDIREHCGNGWDENEGRVAGRAEQVVLALSELDAERLKDDAKNSRNNFWDE